MYLENVTELAFDDITPEDPDFPFIQGDHLACTNIVDESVKVMFNLFSSFSHWIVQVWQRQDLSQANSLTTIFLLLKAAGLHSPQKGRIAIRFHSSI